MPWEYVPPTDDTTVPNKITIRTSQRTPNAARVGRKWLMKRVGMENICVALSDPIIVTSPRGYHQS